MSFDSTDMSYTSAIISSFTEAEAAINEFLNSLRRASSTLESPQLYHPTALLLVGPSGAGKTSLVHDCVSRNKIHLRILSPSELSDEHTGIVESNILTAFFSANQSHSIPSPSLIFIDDLDIWAPAQISTAADRRIIATLNDAISSLREQDQSSRVCGLIATAASEKAVHPSLLRPAVISQVLSLTALSYKERLQWCQNALPRIYPTKTNHSEHLLPCAHHLASIMPGFLHSDMVSYFASLLRLHNTPTFPPSPSQLIGSPVLRKISESFAPALLSHMNPMLSPITNQSTAIAPLTGLQMQIEQLKQCLMAVFTVYSEGNLRTTHSPTTIRALNTLRTLSGVVIHGPTGCGKSALLRQAAALLPHNAVNVIPVDSASIITSVIGQAERQLSSLFAIARTIAPSLILIDNIDILGPRRESQTDNSSSSSQAFNRLLSTLLTEIDGVRSNANAAAVLIISTTRSLHLVDSALLRPGRLDMHIEVALPDAPARLKVLQDLWKSMSLSAPDTFDEISFQQNSDGWTTVDVLEYGRQALETSIGKR